MACFSIVKCSFQNFYYLLATLQPQHKYYFFEKIFPDPSDQVLLYCYRLLGYLVFLLVPVLTVLIK